MSFMKDYKLKKDIIKYFYNYPEMLENIDRESRDILWLKRNDINNFRPLKCNNA